LDSNPFFNVADENTMARGQVLVPEADYSASFATKVIALGPIAAGQSVGILVYIVAL
jgi:hypothetical protein